jgi:hypothetical protein
MANCDSCKLELKELMLGKIKGTFIKGKGKLYKVCSACQSKYSLEELKKRLK